MTFEKYLKDDNTFDYEKYYNEYPALQVSSNVEILKDEYYKDNIFSSRDEAERYCDFRESCDEVVYKVVEFDNLFYVVHRDDASKLCPGQLDW